jgi:hypothetical protein
LKTYESTAQVSDKDTKENSEEDPRYFRDEQGKNDKVNSDSLADDSHFSFGIPLCKSVRRAHRQILQEKY